MSNFSYPYDWQIVNLEDICFINKLSVSENTNDFYFKYIDLSSVDNGRIFFPNDFINFKSAPSRARRKVKNGDILLATVRPNLKGFAYIDFNADEFICSTGFAVLTPKDEICGKYVYYNLFSNSFDNQINNLLVGSNFPAINSSDVAMLKIPLPPLSEQEKIAEILSCWDEAIEKVSSLISLKEKQKKGLMQRLLTGKTRLPGFTQPWKTVKLGEIGKTYTGLSGKNSSDFGSGFPFITYMNIYLNNQIKNDQFEFVNIKENENQNAIKYGDIFFTTSSETPDEVGFASVLLFNPEVNTYLNSFCFGFRLNDFETLLPEFASFYFRSEDVRKIMLKLAQGATRFNLSKNELMKEKITIPSDIAEQKAIADVLQSCDLEIEKLKTKLDLLKLQKKGLMQQLLTGKIRVKVDK